MSFFTNSCSHQPPRGGLLLVCDGGQTRYIFEKPTDIPNLGILDPRNILNPRTFLGPNNILIATWHTKIKGLMAFSATVLQYFGEKLRLALTLSNFLISNPKNILIMHQIAYPKVYYRQRFTNPKKCLTPATYWDQPPLHWDQPTAMALKSHCHSGPFEVGVVFLSSFIFLRLRYPG